jgi:hypothetical protein
MYKVTAADGIEIIIREFADYDTLEKKYTKDTIWTVAAQAEEDEELDEDRLWQHQKEKNKKKDSKHYIHFGIADAISGKSVGVLYHQKYISLLKFLKNRDDSLFSDEFINHVWEDELELEHVSTLV